MKKSKHPCGFQPARPLAVVLPQLPLLEASTLSDDQLLEIAEDRLVKAKRAYRPRHLLAQIGGAMLRLTLPWPPRELSPNARHAHWAQLARAKKRYRAACALTARSQGAGRLGAEKLLVHVRFVLPNRRVRDLDNCIGSMKAGTDGLADVLGVDDSRWHLTHDPLSYDEIGGFVRVEVSPWPA